MNTQYAIHNTHNEMLPIVVVGHVDHGKSTVIGRMLSDTDSLPQGKLEQIQQNCQRNSKPFEYAFLIDALKDEQSQGITIDSARVFFQTKKRKYIIIDAPGHIEFLKNMVTGASRADAALLVIDAEEGVQENSKRHGYLLSMLGVRQAAVLINKMDLVNYSQDVYTKIVTEYNSFLDQLGVEAVCFIPVSGREGDMLADRGENMKWYNGLTVIETLDQFKAIVQDQDLPFRMPVQDIYKFTKFGDDRRIIAGTVVSGQIQAGEELIFYPSGKKSTIKNIELFNCPPIKQAGVDQAIGITLTEQIYIRRGEMAVKAHEQAPDTSSLLKADIFWLGKKPLVKGKCYCLKSGTARVNCYLEEVVKSINAVDLISDDGKKQVSRHEAAEVILHLEKAIAFDHIDRIAATGRFVIVDDYKIVGGGIILEGLKDSFEGVRDEVFLRNYRWIKSEISRSQRMERYDQKPTLILITGEAGEKRKNVAKALEQKLFNEGRIVYFLGIGNVIYGVDADIQGQEGFGEEHLRRLAEVAYLMLDSGMILIITAIELSQNDLNVIRTIVDPDLIEVVWVGDKVTTDIEYDIHISSKIKDEKSVEKIQEKSA